MTVSSSVINFDFLSALCIVYQAKIFSFQETLVADYLNNKNIEEAVSAVREMKAPKHFLSEMLNKMVVFSLDRSDDDKEHVSTLIHTLCTESLVTSENLMQVSSLDLKLNSVCG